VSEPGVVCFFNGQITNAYCGQKAGIDAAYELFGWTEGEFEFNTDRVEEKNNIKQSLIKIIKNALGMLDNGKIRKLGPLRPQSGKPSLPPLDDGVAFIPSPDPDYSYVVAEEFFVKGQNIVEEGNHGNWICVILAGFADVVKQTKTGPLTLSRIGPGALIGDVVILLKRENIRRTTVMAAGDVVLGVLDLNRIHAELALMSKDFKKIFLSLDKRLSHANRNLVKAHAKGRIPDFPSIRGMKTFTPGAKKNEAFFITMGSASVVCRAQKGYVPVADLGVGDFVGKIPFIDIGHESEKAVVLPSDHFMSRQISLTEIMEEYEKAPNIIKCIVRFLSNCVASTTVSMINFSPTISQNTAKKKKSP